jgi:two-component system response regulator YesN
MIATESASDPAAMIELRNAYVNRLMKMESADELVRFARSCLERVFSTREINGSEGRRLVAQAKDMLEGRATEDVTLADVARGVFVSPSYLSRLFKAICGVNFHEYLTTIRIQKAQALLRDSDMSCGEVGRAVGYSNASHFSQTFKTITGYTPSQFREHVNIPTYPGKD